MATALKTVGETRAETALVVHEARPVDLYRMSTDAADTCREIVIATASKIGGRDYVAVEGWMAIAIAHGCIASTMDVHRVTDEGCEGFAATGVLRRMSDGVEIGRAEGFVGDDEKTWGKRDVYARRAMAQTRSVSRVCRSAFAHVVVMMKSGLATTPAEEMPIDVTPHNPQTGEIEDAPREKVPGISKIKERLRALKADGNKIEADDVGALDRFNELIRAAADDLTAVKGANHDWWTGDADYVEGTSGNEGMKRWIVRRRAEMAPHEDSLAFQLLTSTLAEVETKMALQAWLRKNGDQVEALDGEESRRFEELYSSRESAIAAMDSVSV